MILRFLFAAFLFITLESSSANTSAFEPQEITTAKDAAPGFELFKTFNAHVTKLEDYTQRLTAAFAGTYHLYYVKDDKKVVAILGLSYPTELYWKRYMHIDTLVVAESHRRRGIGHQLINFAKELATQEGVTKMSFETGIARKGAQAFYKANGFEPLAYEYRFYPG